jgi:hypothetical protein
MRRQHIQSRTRYYHSRNPGHVTVASSSTLSHALRTMLYYVQNISEKRHTSSKQLYGTEVLCVERDARYGGYGSPSYAENKI